MAILPSSAGGQTLVEWRRERENQLDSHLDRHDVDGFLEAEYEDRYGTGYETGL